MNVITFVNNIKRVLSSEKGFSEWNRYGALVSLVWLIILLIYVIYILFFKG